MMADDAEIDEEIERQLEADARERDYVEEPILNDRELDVNIILLNITGEVSTFIRDRHKEKDHPKCQFLFE